MSSFLFWPFIKCPLAFRLDWHGSFYIVLKTSDFQFSDITQFLFNLIFLHPFIIFTTKNSFFSCLGFKGASVLFSPITRSCGHLRVTRAHHVADSVHTILHTINQKVNVLNILFRSAAGNGPRWRWDPVTFLILIRPSQGSTSGAHRHLAYYIILYFLISVCFYMMHVKVVFCFSAPNIILTRYTSE